MDRMDLHLEVPPVPVKELRTEQPPSESSATIRKRVLAARATQRARYQEEGIYTNAQLKPRLVKRYCGLADGPQELLERAMAKLNLIPKASARNIRKKSRFDISQINKYEEEKEEQKQKTKELETFIGQMENALGESIKKVEATFDLTDSAVCLKIDKEDPNYMMAQMMKQLKRRMIFPI